MPSIAHVAAGARLGLSLGKVFGDHGFDVALIARSPERLGELGEPLGRAGDQRDIESVAAEDLPERQAEAPPGGNERDRGHGYLLS